MIVVRVEILNIGKGESRSIILIKCLKKWKEKSTMGPKNIKWWKCKYEMMVEYMERVRRKYEELDPEKGTVEGEWRQYNDALVGVEEELCGITSVNEVEAEKQKPRMVDGRGGEGSGEKRAAWKMI